MLGNTLLQWGTDEQKNRYLPRILSGADTWCQGYSEPNAGSDLSNLGLRGVLDGDQWVLNGQKIWTSAGHLADHIFTLVRTDPEAPRHKGISFILVDMRQPGIEVRPIRMISGESEFNEVFYTDATAPKDEVVGGVNNGWAVAMTLLGYERGESAATVPIRYQAELDRLLMLAKESGRINDPNIRQRLAWCYSKVQIMRYSGMRTLTKFLHGHHPGPDAAISKLYWSEYHKVVTELALDILGPEAMVPTGRRPSTAFQSDDAGAPNSSWSWVGTFLNARAGTIYAGSSQIQRNIIGEMVLGLPKEPKASLRPWEVVRCSALVVAPSSAVGHGVASVPGRPASTVVDPTSVPADSARRLRALPTADPIRHRRPSHRRRRCAELPLMVQAPPRSGFLIPLVASGNSLAPDGRHR